MNYTANAAGTVGWNLIATPNPPGAAGPIIENPAADAGQYLYFAMDGFIGIDAGGPHQGIFTTSLCGCVAGFLVRTNGGVIRRVIGYHKTNVDDVPAGAVALFNAGGPNGPQPADVNYILRPDKGNYFAGLPDAIQALVGGAVPPANCHSYLRSSGVDHVSWVISLNGDMGEMTQAFADTRNAEQQKAWGVEQVPVIPPAPVGKQCCMPCVIF